MTLSQNYVDELVELYIATLINARMWQTIAAQNAQGGIAGPTIENAHKQHQQALGPLLSEYKTERQRGYGPEEALQVVLPRLQAYR
jgi:hypothetical protein